MRALLQRLNVCSDEFATGVFYGVMTGLLVLVIALHEPAPRSASKIERVVTLPAGEQVDPFADAH